MGLNCLKNVSTEHLLSFFFTSKNPGWLSVLTKFTLGKGVALIVSVEKVVVYSEKEPIELVFPSLELREQLVEAFTNQAKRLDLFCEFAAEFRDKP
jgi:hypothetical protein